MLCLAHSTRLSTPKLRLHLPSSGSAARAGAGSCLSPVSGSPVARSLQSAGLPSAAAAAANKVLEHEQRERGLVPAHESG